MLLIILVGVFGYVLFRTLTLESKQIDAGPVEKFQITEATIQNLSSAIQIRTVSPENIAEFDSLEFNRFNAFLKKTYPLSDSLLNHQLINSYSHLFHWEGSDPLLKPVILMGHVDVVPVIKENRKFWKQEPFGGKIVNDTIWGRGSIDDKVGVIGIMESIERLLHKGARPKRDLYIAFGHDEEIGGKNGAKVIAEHLEEKKVEAAFIMDEGGVISSGMVPGIEKDVALIGTAEKGSVSVQLSIDLDGGHSSMPAGETSIDVLSSAIVKIRSNPFPAHISVPVEGFLRYLGPEMPFVNKMAFANKDLFQKMIIGVYEGAPSSNALIRTTAAPTIFTSGVKDNIIPVSARAIMNFRIISESSVKEVLQHVKKVVNDDRIKIQIINLSNEPSGVSGTDTPGFSIIHKTIAEVYPETLVSPYLMVAATDTRHFSSLSDQIYRFLPTRINKSNVNTFHGLNERISLSEFEDAVNFYTQLIKNSVME